MGKYTLNSYRAQRILDLCVKHEKELPCAIRDEIAALVNDEVRKRETKLADIPFSTRTKNVFWCLDCDTVADVLALGKNKLRVQRNCGKTTIEEIEKAFAELGFTLTERGEERGKNPNTDYHSCKDSAGTCSKALGEKISRCIDELREVEDKLEIAKVCKCSSEKSVGFILRCAADSMYAQIRRIEGDNRTKCTELVDGRCSSKCKSFDVCYWRNLRSVADEYEKVRKEAN